MTDQSKGAYLDFGQAYRKAADYCVIQDRCLSEIKLKLKFWNIDKNFIIPIISKLIEEDFLNEKRFAINYAGGKFRMNGWGKLKIAGGLRVRSLSPLQIQQALSVIENEEYAFSLRKLLQKKLKQLGGDSLLNRQKAARFAISRGFEPAHIAAQLRNNEIYDF